MSKSILKIMKDTTNNKQPKHFTPNKWLHKVIIIMLDTHTQSWSEYCTYKHEKLYNPIEQRTSIDGITNTSEALLFDLTTTKWFHIPDSLLQQMSSDQITS